MCVRDTESCFIFSVDNLIESQQNTHCLFNKKTAENIKILMTVTTQQMAHSFFTLEICFLFACGRPSDEVFHSVEPLGC